jgi:hypothetical protein
MVKRLLTLMLALVAFGAMGAEMPMKGLRLTGDMNAGGHTITNLAPGVGRHDAATIGQINASNELGMAEIRDWVNGVVNDAVAAETAEWQREHLPAYLRKDGGTMTGALTVPQLYSQQGSNKSMLYADFIYFCANDWVNYLYFPPSQKQYDNLIKKHGYFDILATRQWSADRIAAATNAIPPPNPPEPIYAHPAPWTVAAEYVTGAGSGVATNGDVLMTTSASGAYLDYEISARGEPRPAPWAYDPPMVSVEIISDPAGAVASIDSSGAVVVVRASGVQGVALAQVTGGDGAIRDIPLTFSSAGIRVADAWAGDVPGSFRAHCSASTGALFGWISTNDCVAVPGHDAPVPADLFIYRYDAAGAATNAVFADGFIALVSQIFCLSAQKNDTPAVTNGIAISPIGDLYRIQYLAVSEHYAITADHMAPYGRGVDARWYDGSQFIDRGAHHDVGRRGDLRVVRFGVGVPQQCWARFGAVSLLGRLSPTEFSHSVGITLNQHGYVSTTSLSVDATYGASFRRCGVLHGREWTMGDASFGRPQVEAAYHAPHAGDSGHIVFFVLWDASDSLRLVPAVCLSTAETGTDLTDPETLAWIKSTVEWHSGGVETIQFWREEDFE